MSNNQTTEPAKTTPLTLEQLGHPCCGQRPLAVAERCEVEGLDNAAATIRGLLEERTVLLRILKADDEVDDHEFIHALRDARKLVEGRAL